MLRSPEHANHIFILAGYVCFEFCILGDKHGTLFLFSEKKGSYPGFFFTNNHRLLHGPLQLTCLHKFVVLSTSGKRKIVRLPYGNTLRIPGLKRLPTSPYFMLCLRAAGVGGAWNQSKTRAASPPKSIMSCSARVQKANTRSSDLFPHCHTVISLLLRTTVIVIFILVSILRLLPHMAAPSPLLVLPLLHLYLNFGSSLFTGYMLDPHDTYAQNHRHNLPCNNRLCKSGGHIQAKIQSCVPLTLNDALPYLHPYYRRAPWLLGFSRISLNCFHYYVCHLPSVQIRVSNMVCHSFLIPDWAVKVQFNSINRVVSVSSLQFCTFNHLTLALPSNFEQGCHKHEKRF